MLLHYFLSLSKVANIKLQVTNFRKKFTDIQTNINNLLLKVNETIDDLEILENDIKNKMDEKKLCTLEDVFDVCVGIKTTADSVFVFAQNNCRQNRCPKKFCIK